MSQGKTGGDFARDLEVYCALAGLDPDLLQQFITLYLHSSLVDPGRQRTGVDLFRCFEYALTWRFGDFSEDDTVLDLGSGGSVWPTFLLAFGCRVVATDLEIDNLRPQEALLGRLQRDEYPGTLTCRCADATQLPDPDGSFTRITAISSIEHIPGDGDLVAVGEFARVLRPGGRAVITAPYSREFTEGFADYYGGYEKRYDERRLARLVDSSKMTARNLAFLNGRFPGTSEFAETWYAKRLYDHFGHVSPFIAMALLETTPSPTDDSIGFVLSLAKDPP